MEVKKAGNFTVIKTENRKETLEFIEVVREAHKYGWELIDSILITSLEIPENFDIDKWIKKLKEIKKLEKYIWQKYYECQNRGGGIECYSLFIDFLNRAKNLACKKEKARIPKEEEIKQLYRQVDSYVEKVVKR
ncbi:hypothetical protein [Desulfurobacterium sp.]|uniref:hypothetical protein n=1 Tax=Desulfurobacterium sp. TaxID=2004706 RepID=UPI0026239201|nr:hypothetical protein [Desulfurobacterium sp.]